MERQNQSVTPLDLTVELDQSGVQPIRQGATVTVGGKRGVVSSIAPNGAMVCFPINGSYQLRGPIAAEHLVVVFDEERRSDG